MFRVEVSFPCSDWLTTVMRWTPGPRWIILRRWWLDERRNLRNLFEVHKLAGQYGRIVQAIILYQSVSPSRSPVTSAAALDCLFYRSISYMELVLYSTVRSITAFASPLYAIFRQVRSIIQSLAEFKDSQVIVAASNNDSQFCGPRNFPKNKKCWENVAIFFGLRTSWNHKKNPEAPWNAPEVSCDPLTPPKMPLRLHGPIMVQDAKNPRKPMLLLL